jgi:DNA-binding MarR family transcriptional regulator
MEEQKVEQSVKKETKKTTAKKATTKSTETKKQAAKKATTAKSNDSKKSVAKKPAAKKPAKKKTLAKAPVKTTKVATPTAKVTKTPKKVEVKDNLDQILDVAVQTENPKVELSKNVTTVQKVKKMPDVKRPQPKPRNFTKEEKVSLKKLEEAFTYVANMTTVIEEKTMDYKQIPDLTISELHVVEMVNKYNNKPMTIIANKLNVTVGSLITCVNRLIQKDYLIRTRDEMDHRVILLSVTPKAKKVLKVHDKFHNDILLLALEGTPLSYAVKVMTQFAATLENYMNPKEEKEKEKKAKK